MVNGLHLYSAFIQSAVKLMVLFSLVHPSIHHSITFFLTITPSLFCSPHLLNVIVTPASDHSEAGPEGEQHPGAADGGLPPHPVPDPPLPAAL